MNPILVVLPFCEKDVENAKRLLGWINELHGDREGKGGVWSQHSMLLAADSNVSIETCKELGAIARKSFRQVDPLVVTVNDKTWKAANLMFNSVSQFVMQTYKLPFLWLEPDCTPMREHWLDDLSRDYAMCPRKYMGCQVPCKDPKLPSLHLTGCAIYPPDAFVVLDKHSNSKAEQAWDIASASDIVARGKSQHTGLIWHMYGEADLAPTFVLERNADSPINAIEVSKIPDGTALAHRCKDGTLISCLRKLRAAHVAPEPAIPDPVVTHVKTPPFDPGKSTTIKSGLVESIVNKMTGK